MRRKPFFGFPALAAAGLGAGWVTAVVARSAAPEPQQTREGLILPPSSHPAIRAQQPAPPAAGSQPGSAPPTAQSGAAPGQKIAAARSGLCAGL